MLYLSYKFLKKNFPKKSIYPGGLISEGAYNRRDLHVSNLMGLNPVGPKTRRAYNRILRDLRGCIKEFHHL